MSSRRWTGVGDEHLHRLAGFGKTADGLPRSLVEYKARLSAEGAKAQ
jgi:hypothetical protein